MISLTPTPQTERETAEFLRRLDELANPGDDAIHPIQEGIRAGFAAVFASEGAASGAPWAELAAYTQRQREQLGFPAAHPILERTGIYRRSFVDEFHVNHVSEWSAGGGAWTVEEGSSDDRADILEYGDPRTPARPVTILGNAGEARLGMILDHMFGEWFE